MHTRAAAPFVPPGHRVEPARLVGWRRWMVLSLGSVATLLAPVAFLLLLVGGAPSDPCTTTDPLPRCGTGTSQRWLFLIGLAAALIATATVVAMLRLRRLFLLRLQFNTPPGWPDPPHGWRPTQPVWLSPDLPAPPDGWRPWRDPYDHAVQPRA